MRHRFPHVIALAAAGFLLAGCGGGKKETAPPPPLPPLPTSAAANAAYERANSECATTRLADLAAKYHAKKNRDAIATAVGRSWARTFKGGIDAETAGKEGCNDALDARFGPARSS